ELTGSATEYTDHTEYEVASDDAVALVLRVFRLFRGLERHLESQPIDPRPDDRRRAQEPLIVDDLARFERHRAAAGDVVLILRRVRVRDVERVEEQAELQSRVDPEPLLDARIEDRHVVLPPRSPRLRRERQLSARGRTERDVDEARDRRALLVPQHGRYRDAVRRLIAAEHLERAGGVVLRIVDRLVGILDERLIHAPGPQVVR